MTDTETLRKLVKPLDLATILRHAFLSGVVAARSIPGHEEINGPELWVDYEPYEPGPYTRILAALTPSPEAQAGPIKPLIWDDQGVAEPKGFGLRYLLNDPSESDESNGWYVLEESTNTVIEADGSEQAARDAAQQDFNVRIRSAYAHPPAPQPDLAARNWAEDAPHENGNYTCICHLCGNEFIGHKRRVTCKLCAVPEAKPDLAQEQLKVMREALEYYGEGTGDMGEVARAALASVTAAQEGA